MAIANTTFTITDPRTFDGDPYQVAERAVSQSEALATILLTTLDATERMARNAFMQRGHQASAWPESAEGRRYKTLRKDLTDVESSLGFLKRAASFNPKAAL